MNVIFLILDAKYCFNSILCPISSLCNYLVYYEIYLFGYCELGYWSQFQMAFKTLQITIVFGRQRYFNLQYYSFLYLYHLIKLDFDWEWVFQVRFLVVSNNAISSIIKFHPDLCYVNFILMMRTHGWALVFSFVK